MTKEEIFNSHMNKAGINFRSSLQTYEKILDAMQEYAELYHQSKLKNNGDLGDVVSSLIYNADHLWKKATEFHYALEKNGYLCCLEDLEKEGIIELKNIDKNH